MTRRSERVIPGPPLRGYLFAFCDIDDVDGKVGQLGAEGCLDLVAARRK
jgi:hypothetical protein